MLKRLFRALLPLLMVALLITGCSSTSPTGTDTDSGSAPQITENGTYTSKEGKSIGGDRFGNYDTKLPEAKGRTWKECDINSEGGYRGSERIIYSSDGLIYYTNDHYNSFKEITF